MAGKLTIPGDHPSLPGHFPGNPVVPGVVILNEIVRMVETQLFGKFVVGFKFIKFVKPLRPDSEVVVRWKEKGTDMLDITCEHNDCVVVKGQLALSEKDIA